MINVPSVRELDEAVRNLPEMETDPSYRAKHANFFERFGSHYIKSAWVGGKASLAFVVAKSSNLTKDEVRANIQVAIGVLRSSDDKQRKAIDERFRSASTCRVFGSGGDRIQLAKLSSLEKNAYEDWIESVKTNPQVIQFGLLGIWTLVKDERKAAALKNAYMQESGFTPLTAIVPLDMSVYFLKDDDIFEYKLPRRPSNAGRVERSSDLPTATTRRVERNPRLLESFKKTFAPPLEKFARPDAAISLNGFPDPFSNVLYLFKHGDCVRLKTGASLSLEPGYPRPIGEDWPGVDFDRVDAALTVAPSRVYFFRGPQYIRIDVAKGEPLVVGTRDLIKKRWTGVTFDRLDTAVYWWNSKVYFFYGDQYIRYDMTLYRADPGYPRYIESNYIEDWEFFE